MDKLIFAIIIALVILPTLIKEVKEYERGVLFGFGRFVKVLNPGWHIIIPVIRSLRIIDIRTKAVDVPWQEAITKDNVSVKINAVIYYNIFDASLTVITVENYKYAVEQLAQTTMRNIVGSVTLDELLSERDALSQKICKIVDVATDPWGVKVDNVELKDISLPEEMKRVIAKAAEAEREKAAVITKAVGEVEASKNLAAAATTLSEAPGALHLRTLSTINDVSSDQSNTIIFAMPLEILKSFEGKNNQNDLSEVIKLLKSNSEKK